MVSNSHYADHRQGAANQSHPLGARKPQPKSSAAPPSRSSQPRVYNVKPIHFRELVQSLTGAAPPQRLHTAVPTPAERGGSPGFLAAPPPVYQNGFAAGEGAEVVLSPTSCSWFSFPMTMEHR